MKKRLQYFGDNRLPNTHDSTKDAQWESGKIIIAVLRITSPTQNSSEKQFGHSFSVLLFLHSSGKHPQSAHLTSMGLY